MSVPVFRFAPSPNGYLHLGHALSALINFDMAHATGGRFLLRIEDIDTTRCRPEFEAAIYEDLAWLGLSWEEPVRRQSDHLDVYADALQRLVDAGLAYPSFESRAEIARMVAVREAEGPWPRDPDGAPLYPGGRREAGDDWAGTPFAWRIDMQAATARAGALTWRETGAGPGGETGTVTADPAAWGDVVVARKEIATSYHLAVVVDDALQGISHVVRGQDLFFATSVHRLLQALLGLPEPVYHHHRLIRDQEGRKLSKSNHATALRALRAEGLSAADVRRLCGLG